MQKFLHSPVFNFVMIYNEGVLLLLFEISLFLSPSSQLPALSSQLTALTLRFN